MTVDPGAQRDLARAFARVARTLQSEQTAQLTLQKIVDLAPTLVEGCDHAGVSMVVGPRVETPAASDPVPMRVDLLQQELGEGPCLDAIRHHQVFTTDDLTQEARWPLFSRRAVAETGVRSVLSFRLFVEQDTFGSLNLYSRRPAAFGEDSRASGEVFAAQAAVALATAREHDRARRLQRDLTSSQDDVEAYQQQVQAAVTLQRSMLPQLPDLGAVQLAARYVPAVQTAEVGGDWYDAFVLPAGRIALVVGDVAGHDTAAAVRMSQLRNVLRALAVDRVEPVGDLLRRLDRVSSHLQVTDTATCVCVLLEPSGRGPARMTFANAGHPPPLLVTADGTAHYLESAEHLLLGVGGDQVRSSTSVELPAGSTLLLYTDGLVEHRAYSISDGLDRLRLIGATLAGQPLERLCDTLVSELAAEPGDDVCLLALRVPDA